MALRVGTSWKGSPTSTKEHAQQAYDDEQEILLTEKAIINKLEKETWEDKHTTWVSSTKGTPLPQLGRARRHHRHLARRDQRETCTGKTR
jgi:hypothetical protein